MAIYTAFAAVPRTLECAATDAEAVGRTAKDASAFETDPQLLAALGAEQPDETLARAAGVDGFEEGKHPRASDGKFGSGQGSAKRHADTFVNEAQRLMGNKNWAAAQSHLEKVEQHGDEDDRSWARSMIKKCKEERSKKRAGKDAEPQPELEELAEDSFEEGKHPRADDGKFGSGGGKPTKKKEAQSFDRDTDFGAAKMILREKGTPKDIAKKLGMSESFVSDVVSGKYGKSDAELKKALKDADKPELEELAEDSEQGKAATDWAPGTADVIEDTALQIAQGDDPLLDLCNGRVA